jgi:hypothetical protein
LYLIFVVIFAVWVGYSIWPSKPSRSDSRNSGQDDDNGPIEIEEPTPYNVPPEVERDWLIDKWRDEQRSKK